MNRERNMRAIRSMLRLQTAGDDSDAILFRLAQMVCYIVAAFVFVAGLLSVSRLDLPEAQLFGAVQQVVQTSLLFGIFGLLLSRKSDAA